MIVLDASAVVNACLSEQGFGFLAAEDPVAPPLLWSEVTSALHELTWRRAISPELARVALERLLGSPVQPRHPSGLHSKAWRLADQLGWAKTYDAEYVALARHLGCRLVTIDGRLRRIASSAAEIIGPTEL